MRSILIALIWVAVLGGMFGCIAAMKENGATDHPLLVDAAQPLTPCFVAHPCSRINCQRRIA